MGKIVKNEFKAKHSKITPTTDEVEQKIVNKYVTGSFVEKTYSNSEIEMFESRIRRDKRRRDRKATADHYRATVRAEGRAAHGMSKMRQIRNELKKYMRDAVIKKLAAKKDGEK